MWCNLYCTLLVLAFNVTQFVLHMFNAVCWCDAFYISHLVPSVDVMLFFTLFLLSVNLIQILLHTLVLSVVVMHFVLLTFCAVCWVDNVCIAHISCCLLMWLYLYCTLLLQAFNVMQFLLYTFVLSVDKLRFVLHNFSAYFLCVAICNSHT